VLLHNVQAGDLFLFVDNFCASTGACVFNETEKVGLQDATLKILPATLPPSNDSCLTPAALFPDGGTQSVVQGTVVNAYDDYFGACQLYSGDFPDVVYSFNMASAGSFSVSGIGDPGSPVVPMLTVVPAAACDPDAGTIDLANAAGCVFAPERHQPGNLVIDNLPAGNYLLIADTWIDSSSFQTNHVTPLPPGTFTLTSSIGPVNTAAANNTCGTAQALVAAPLTDYATSTLHATVTGTTEGAANNHVATCTALGALPDGGFGPTNSTGPDQAYTFTTPAFSLDGGMILRAAVLAQNFDQILPLVFIEKSCNDPDAGFDCIASQNFGGLDSFQATDFIPADPATTYTIWVDTNNIIGDGGTAGPFSLEVDVASLPVNDICTTAIPAAINTSRAGTTLGATNNYDSNGVIGNSCNSLDMLSADVVYSLSGLAATPVTVTVTPQNGYDTAVWILDGCMNTSTTPGVCVTAADDGLQSAVETVKFTPVAGHNYFVVVDGPADFGTGGTTARGGFTLSVAQ